MISLVAIDLGENRITRLEPDCFIGNGLLEIMVLDYNEVRQGAEKWTWQKSPNNLRVTS